MKFSNYLLNLSTALVDKSGVDLAYLLSPRKDHGKTIIKEFRNPTRQSMKQFEGSMESPWDEIAIQYVLVVNHIARNKPIEAFKEEAHLVSLFFRYFTSNSGWTLMALFSMLRDLRDLAIDVTYENGQSGTMNMEEAARVISKAFTNCVMDRQSPYVESRKWGVYYVVGLIMKSYFRVKRISLSKNILRAINANPDIPPLTAYPRSHQVIYRYYVGMLEFLNEDFVKVSSRSLLSSYFFNCVSEQELTLAFYTCHIAAKRNQERILIYLIPLRILRGHLPSRELLDRFPNLDKLFSPFVSAIRKGDLSAFDAVLEKSERRLVELNLLLTVERARELCMRVLFRRVWVVSEKSNRMPISLFHSALQVSGQDVPVEEAECFVANMIYKGFMRGYISHEKQMVVVANTNAFPRPADRVSPYANL
ncbi:hypothetical protein BDY19DRAFT_883602 [Irpex rosettiformis]|uniref:Uncharacterized protein n=1 Tax=Irpex rosettiformis TaxID=378272 RepID=A0ACB8UFG1_9APHY|nr:hypothetical protein BDY19DRAFT_883602 [Irpex rosettiformis]